MLYQVSVDGDLFRTIAELMATRRSIRRYASDGIPQSVVDELLRCAASAPSAHNRQPWRFAVLRTSESKNHLARTMGARLRADRLHDGDSPSVIDDDVQRSFLRISNAPVVLVVALTMVDMDVYRDKRRSEAERQMAVQGTAMAVQNLMLAGHALGISSCWMCAPLFCQDAVRAALSLPADWQPQGLVTLGIPESRGKPYSRRSLAEFVRHIDL